MGRRPCCDKEGVNKGAWSSEEDGILFNFITVHGEGRWRNVAKSTGLKRCGKSCRLRWLNYLKPGIKRGDFSKDEEDLIFRLHRLLGNRWALIAGRLPGRTDNEIKNYWNTVMVKKLEERQQDLPWSSSTKPMEDYGEEKPFQNRTSTEGDERKASMEKNPDDSRTNTASKDDQDIDCLDFLMNMDFLNSDFLVNENGSMSKDSFPSEDFSPSSENNNEIVLEKDGMRDCGLLESEFDMELKRVASFLELEDEFSQFPGRENLS